MCIMFMCVDTNCPFVVGVSVLLSFQHIYLHESKQNCNWVQLKGNKNENMKEQHVHKLGTDSLSLFTVSFRINKKIKNKQEALQKLKPLPKQLSLWATFNFNGAFMYFVHLHSFLYTLIYKNI